jgi:murein L,D-transpeptidase YafK
MKHIYILIIPILLLSTGICSENSKPWKNPANTYTNYTISLNKLVDSLKLNKTHVKILVVKSKYILSILIDNTTIKSYPCVLGFNPVDDKLREGDGCTPEGKFMIKAKYPHALWSKFIWFDYPNEASRIKHKQAKERGTISKDSRIGGDVGIHGVPINADYLIDKKENWTLGCVSLKNKDINEIYNFVAIGMSVEIRR